MKSPHPWFAPVELSVAAIVLWALRMLMYGPEYYAWLPLNLALAWIPMLLGFLVARIRSMPLALLLSAAWLLFLPNAPYLVTDLIHVESRPPAPLWFDAAMLGAFALAGPVILGVTTWEVGRRWRAPGLAFGFVIAALCGFGIVLGRFESRWNSWDLVVQPAALLLDVLDRVTNPGEHLRTWLATAVYGLLCAASIRAVAVLRLAPIDGLTDDGAPGGRGR